MEKQSDSRLQRFATGAIFIIYLTAMAVNAVQAATGKAELARHHFIPFGLVTYAWLASIPAESYRRLKEVICAIILAVAKGMLSLVKTFGQLPGMIIKALVTNYQQA